MKGYPNPPPLCGHSAPCGCLSGGPCCLTCPLPVCVLEPTAPHKLIPPEKREAIRAAVARGSSRAEVGREFRVAIRTVQRITKEA